MARPSPFMTPYNQNLTRPNSMRPVEMARPVAVARPVAQPAPVAMPPQTGGLDPRPTGASGGTMPQLPNIQQIMQILKGRSGGSGMMRTAGDIGGPAGIDSANGLGHEFGSGPSNSVGQPPSSAPGIEGLVGYSGISPFGTGWGQVTPGTPATPSMPGPVANVGNVGRPGMGYGPSAGSSAGAGPAPGSDPNGYGGFANNGYGSMGYGVTPGGLAGYDSNGNAVAAGSAADTGGASSSKIVCTAMNEDYGFGSFRQAIWLRHSAGMSRAHERGYHAIFRPLLDWARKRATAPQRIVMAALEDIARMRTFDIRREARAGVRRGLNRGRVYRAILEPICYIVGRLAR